MNPQEFERLSKVFLLLTDIETRDFLWDKRRRNRQFPRRLAKALGIEDSKYSEFALINFLIAHLSKIRKSGDEPTFECVGCGGTTEASGLRWDKLNRGEAVTVSVDHSGKPATLDWLTDAEIMKYWFEPWTVGNPNVKFKLLKTGRGDSHITFEPVDGPGNTLKFVWQPNQGEEMDTSEPSGNMVCDNTERSYPKPLVRLGGKHEVGHVLGIGHLDSRSDVMYFQADNRNKPLSKNDLAERDKRHPIVKIS